MLRMALVGIVLFFISGCATSQMTVVVESHPPEYRPVIRVQMGVPMGDPYIGRKGKHHEERRSDFN